MFNNNPVIVTKETYISMPAKDKLNVLYDISTDTRLRLKSLEKRKRFDSALSFSGGILGGFTAIVAKWIFWEQK